MTQSVLVQIPVEAKLASNQTEPAIRRKSSLENKKFNDLIKKDVNKFGEDSNKRGSIISNNNANNKRGSVISNSNANNKRNSIISNSNVNNKRRSEDATSLLNSDTNSVHAPVVNSKNLKAVTEEKKDIDSLKSAMKARLEAMRKKRIDSMRDFSKKPKGDRIVLETNDVVTSDEEVKITKEKTVSLKSIEDFRNVKQKKQDKKLKKLETSESVEKKRVSFGKNEKVTEDLSDSTAFDTPVKAKRSVIEIEDGDDNTPKKPYRPTSSEYAKMIIPVKKLNLSKPAHFANNPIKKGKVIQLTVVRDKSGFTNKFFPKFHLYFSEGFATDKRVHLMSARKRGGNKSSNYIISLSKTDFDRKSVNCLGKLRSNFTGTKFRLFNAGENPKKRTANPSNVRSELLNIYYVS